jgi:hypothetical protein
VLPDPKVILPKGGMNHEADEEMQKWIEVANSLNPGDVFPLPINHGESWMVVHFLEKKGETYKFEAVNFHKINFQQWFDQEKSKIEIIGYDKSYPMP